MKTVEQIQQHKEQLEGKLALKIARACVGYRENIGATMNEVEKQIKEILE